MPFKQVIYLLGALGLLPFLAPVIALYLDVFILDYDPVTVFITYSCIILTFLSGSLWGQLTAELHQKDDHAAKLSKVPGLLAVVTNLIAIGCWIVLLNQSFSPSKILLLLAFSFVFILWVESMPKVASGNLSGNGYLKMRWLLTIIVCACHLNVIYFI